PLAVTRNSSHTYFAHTLSVHRMPLDLDIVSNEDSSVNAPLGRAVERWIYSLPVVSVVKLNCQSRKKLNEAVKEELISFERVPNAFDHLEWTTSRGVKSTNRLDDIISLTDKGRKQAEAVLTGNGRNRKVWWWVHFCPGYGNCRRKCGGLGQCSPTCPRNGHT